MPRSVGGILLIAVGSFALYQAMADPFVRLRGMKRSLAVWQGRTFLGMLALIGIVGGLLVWFGPF